MNYTHTYNITHVTTTHRKNYEWFVVLKHDKFSAKVYFFSAKSVFFFRKKCIFFPH